MKVVINKCYGGFGVSMEAVQWLREHGQKEAIETVIVGEKWANGEVCEFDYRSWMGRSTIRHDPLLVECVETLGSKRASGWLAELAIIEIPDGIEYKIDEYDGIETVHEIHKSWG